MTSDCPKCGKYTFKVNAPNFIGRCHNCGYEEIIDKDTWNLKYDDGYKILRGILKFSRKERDGLIKILSLDDPNSHHSKFLLTEDVLTVLEKEEPKTFTRLVKAV
jgi:predicted nucleic-acid-binding Zn-ribbon protein